MTTFEEKLKTLPIKIIEHPIGYTKYYSAANVKFLIAKADAEIEYLKSQLEPQDLPVVPKEFDEWYQEIVDSWSGRSAKSFALYKINQVGFGHRLETVHDEPANIKADQWVCGNQIRATLAIINGYTVEKTKLFFLKDELTGQFLAKDNRLKDEEGYFYWTGADPLTHSIGRAWKLTFTQQEIDKMQNSLEQIEVVE